MVSEDLLEELKSCVEGCTMVEMLSESVAEADGDCSKLLEKLGS